jgi:hypothetical protein
MAVMDRVSRPLIGLLVATVAFFALWLVALKPSSSTSAATSGGLGQYQAAINAAHNAVKTAAKAGPAQGAVKNTAATTPAPTTATATPAAATPAATTQPSKPAVAARPRHLARATANRISVVERALRSHKVIALLFYNPAAADDRAVKRELAAVTRDRGAVVKLTVPLSELARYTVVTNQVGVSSSPTLVLIDPARQATTIVGFADRFEISQRVASALTVKAPK